MSLPAALDIGGRTVPLEVRRDGRARRLSLSADAALGVVRLTLPARVALRDGETLIARNRAWLARQVGKWPVATAFEPGALLPFDGRELVIDWHPDHPRTAHIDETRLRIGGPRDGLPARIERSLRRAAQRMLWAEAAPQAERVGRPITRLTLRDPRGRWASCSSTGALSFSWRLVLAPGWVRSSVVAHEVAHLVHMDHSAAFWQLAAELYGGEHDPARAWLAVHGPGLHWVGRG